MACTPATAPLWAGLLVVFVSLMYGVADLTHPLGAGLFVAASALGVVGTVAIACCA